MLSAGLSNGQEKRVFAEVADPGTLIVLLGPEAEGWDWVHGGPGGPSV